MFLTEKLYKFKISEFQRIYSAYSMNMAGVIKRSFVSSATHLTLPLIRVKVTYGHFGIAFVMLG